MVPGRYSKKPAKRPGMTPTFRKLFFSDPYVSTADPTLINNTDDKEFHLGKILTETSHPKTRTLSHITKKDLQKGLSLLMEVDRELLPVFERMVTSGLIKTMAEKLSHALLSGGKVFFCGCGATGRLSIYMESLWRGFWQRMRHDLPGLYKKMDDMIPDDIENRVFSVMAGGDYALIKSVEHFEDRTDFGEKQLEEMGVKEGDVVFSVTEGGETSFVIGTAHKGIKAGAAVYFVYNNPDETLDAITRSRGVLKDTRITKINLTTGPQAIAGSTRMQAASIETMTLGTVLLHAIFLMIQRSLSRSELERIGFPGGVFNLSDYVKAFKKIPEKIVSKSDDLVKFIELETSVYTNGGNFFTPDDPFPERGFVTYIAGDLSGLVVLTDTTERSPTFNLPPFRKKGDTTGKASPSYLVVRSRNNKEGWDSLLKRPVRGLEWGLSVGKEDVYSFCIGGKEAFEMRPAGKGNLHVNVVIDHETMSFANQNGSGIGTVVLVVNEENGRKKPVTEAEIVIRIQAMKDPLYLLQGITLKVVLNAVSTLSMVKLGRVNGNLMTHVTPSNKKLIDRASRLVSILANVQYTYARLSLLKVLDDFKTLFTNRNNSSPAVPVAAICILFAVDTHTALDIYRENDNDYDAAVEACEAAGLHALELLLSFFKKNNDWKSISKRTGAVLSNYCRILGHEREISFSNVDELVSFLKENPRAAMIVSRILKRELQPVVT